MYAVTIQKEYLIKSCILFLLEEYVDCISYLGECAQLIHPMVVIYCLWLIKLKIDKWTLHLHLRVDLSDGRGTLVSEGGNKGVDEELQYMDVTQDLDPSLEGPKANLASEGKPRNH
jgi:hypothetical protein